jgi:hypothetical protein
MELSDVRAFAEMGAEVVERLNAGTITIAGETYAAAVGKDPLTSSSARGGEFFEGDRIVHIRKEILATKPERKTTVTLEGKLWTVVSSKGDEAAAVVWSLHLKPRN